jgi:hypothetical protein
MTRTKLRLIAVAAVLSSSMTALPATASALPVRASCPPDLPRAGYSDVYPLSPHAFDIDCLAWRSIVGGDGTFGPHDPLARWEMAVWLDLALRWVQDRYGSVPSPFTDTVGLAAAESIGAIGQMDVTRGVGEDRFDPYGAVPRWQMALFLTRAFEAAGNELPDPVDQGFADIAGTTPEARTAIDQLAMLGITRGTGPATFSPDQAVTREQMASFVARLLEEIWVIHPVVSTCDTASVPVRCSGTMTAVSPPGDVRIRVPMFMAEHVGDLDAAATRFGDPGTRIELFVDGVPLDVQSSEFRHSGAVYRYWEGTLGAGVTGTVTVEARTYLAGMPVTIREVVIDFR